MSMYALALGDGQEASREAVLLAMLGNPNPGRLRDAWVEQGEDGAPVIAIYTRNGGGNRECYCDDYTEVERGTCTGCVGEALAEHPLCIKSPDDDFDRTYRTYYFTAPPEHREFLASVAGEHIDTSQRWLDLIQAISRGSYAQSPRDRIGE